MTEDCEMPDGFSTVFLRRFSIWHFPYVFLGTCTNGFIFKTEDVTSKMASVQCSFLKLVHLPFLMLLFPIRHMLPSSWQIMGLGKPFPYPLLPEITSMAVSLRFNTRIGKPWCFHWSTLPCLYKNMVRWIDWWHFPFVFTQLLKGFPPHDWCELRDAFLVVFLHGSTKGIILMLAGTVLYNAPNSWHQMWGARRFYIECSLLE